MASDLLHRILFRVPAGGPPARSRVDGAPANPVVMVGTAVVAARPTG